MSIRAAHHAGSWYPSESSELKRLLDDIFGQAAPVSPNVPLKAIVAPHAAYRYSGASAAWAYKSVDILKVRRVFILGPCHHTYVDGCALPEAGVQAYSTPLGDVQLDLEVLHQLKSQNECNFKSFKLKDDEEEHSIEMQLPILQYCFSTNPKFKIVPIYVGSLMQSEERVFGHALARYFDDPHSLFVVSSDFCHWGHRFRFTPTFEEASIQPLVYPPNSTNGHIEALDRRGMDLIKKQDGEGFVKYLQSTGNTICGRNCISILLEVLRQGKTKCSMDFVHYSQSGMLPDTPTRNDSCVSYAAGLCYASP